MIQNNEIVAKIFDNATFRAFGVILEDEQTEATIRDGTFYLRKDGLLVNAEGWYHPPGLLVGEVLYAPDPSGHKEFFGIPYRKVSLLPKSYEPVPYAERARLLARYDP